MPAPIEAIAKRALKKNGYDDPSACVSKSSIPVLSIAMADIQRILITAQEAGYGGFTVDELLHNRNSPWPTLAA